MAGSATMPSTRVHSVMPSCAAASRADTCCRPHRTLFARRSPSLRVRFDLAAAYGDQGELAAHEEGVDDQRRQADQELDRGHRSPSGGVVGLLGPRRVQQDAGRAVARGVHDVEPPSGHLDAVADGRDPAELGGDQAGERLVGAVGDAQADPLRAGRCGRRRRRSRGRGPRRPRPPGRGRGSRADRARPAPRRRPPRRCPPAVATPAVPPYSSMTTAIVRFPESRSSSRSTVRVSGTRSGSRIRSDTERRPRSSAGTARTSLMCATPTTESRLPR